jgi:hypothetical protein
VQLRRSRRVAEHVRSRPLPLAELPFIQEGGSEEFPYRVDCYVSCGQTEPKCGCWCQYFGVHFYLFADQPKTRILHTDKTAMSLPGETADASQQESRSKTREEYLIRREDQLLFILRESFQTLNRSVALSYGVAAVVLLVSGQVVHQLNISGLSLPLDLPDVTTAAPLGLFLVAVFTDYALVRISSILGEIKRNTDALLSINREAKPVTIHDMHLFGAGITGLILALARWPLHLLRSKERAGPPYRSKPTESLLFHWVGEALYSVYKLCQWAAVLLTGGAAILVFCVPFVLAYLAVVGLPAQGKLPIRPASPNTLSKVRLGLPLALSGLSVLICGIRLFAYYSIEYIQAMGHEFADLVQRYGPMLRRLANEEKRFRPD